MTVSSPLQIADLFLATKIPFAVIGGFAVNAHGYVRSTEDVDILFQRTPESQQRLFELLTEIEAYYIGSEIDPETGVERIHKVTRQYVAEHRLLMLGTRLGYLDLFDFVPGIPDASVAAVLQSAKTIDGRPFVDLYWLRRMKVASDRPQDRIDLQNLPSA